jgi:bacterioferritin-associated ferredoxin
MAISTIPEEWRPVEGWPYDVSSLGRVRRAEDALNGNGRVTYPKGYMLSQATDSHGYKYVCLCRSGKVTNMTVSKLVCAAFHGPKPTNRHQAAHWDGDKKNNRADNLRWATPKDNCGDRFRHGTSVRGKQNPRARLTENDVRQIRTLIASGTLQTDVAKMFSVSKQCVASINCRRIWAWLD